VGEGYPPPTPALWGRSRCRSRHAACSRPQRGGRRPAQGVARSALGISRRDWQPTWSRCRRACEVTDARQFPYENSGDHGADRQTVPHRHLERFGNLPKWSRTPHGNLPGGPSPRPPPSQIRTMVRICAPSRDCNLPSRLRMNVLPIWQNVRRNARSRRRKRLEGYFLIVPDPSIANLFYSSKLFSPIWKDGRIGRIIYNETTCAHARRRTRTGFIAEKLPNHPQPSIAFSIKHLPATPSLQIWKDGRIRTQPRRSFDRP
jgi:hypothetical protein